jgi:hypothetical protein
MILTAENGWFSGFVAYGPDRISELRQAVDRHREEEGLPPVDWIAKALQMPLSRWAPPRSGDLLSSPLVIPR